MDVNYDVDDPVWVYFSDLRMWWPGFIEGISDREIFVGFYDTSEM
jgi:hypothetical protein